MRYFYIFFWVWEFSVWQWWIKISSTYTLRDRSASNMGKSFKWMDNKMNSIGYSWEGWEDAGEYLKCWFNDSREQNLVWFSILIEASISYESQSKMLAEFKLISNENSMQMFIIDSIKRSQCKIQTFVKCPWP